MSNITYSVLTSGPLKDEFPHVINIVEYASNGWYQPLGEEEYRKIKERRMELQQLAFKTFGLYGKRWVCGDGWDKDKGLNSFYCFASQADAMQWKLML